jgi:hypothetical protein
MTNTMRYWPESATRSPKTGQSGGGRPAGAPISEQEGLIWSLLSYGIVPHVPKRSTCLDVACWPTRLVCAH